MRDLTANTLLSIWETGSGLHPLDRSLIVLDSALPEIGWSALAAAPIIQRDLWLLMIHERTFGTRLDSYAECLACGERLEFTLQTSSFQVNQAEQKFDETFWIETQDASVAYHLPNSFDLAAAAAREDAATGRELLLRRTIVNAESIPVNAETLEAVAAAMDRQMASVDLSFELICPVCGHQWKTLLDIGQFLWKEIESSAKRLLREVDLLARAYGWREADILAMSTVRRNTYLQMVLS